MTTATSRRNFGGFLFWYVALQCLLTVGIILVMGIIGLAGGYYGFVDPTTWEQQLTNAEPAIRGGGVIATLVLCIVCASAHNLGFWRGVGGWFAGNIIATLIALPILIFGETGFGLGVIQDFLALMALCLVYAASSIGLMIWKHRRTRKPMPDVAGVFE